MLSALMTSSLACTLTRSRHNKFGIVQMGIRKPTPTCSSLLFEIRSLQQTADVSKKSRAEIHFGNSNGELSWDKLGSYDPRRVYFSALCPKENSLHNLFVRTVACVLSCCERILGEDVVHAAVQLVERSCNLADKTRLLICIKLRIKRCAWSVRGPSVQLRKHASTNGTCTRKHDVWVVLARVVYKSPNKARTTFC